MAARKKPIGDIKEADLADLEKKKVGESNAKVQIVKLYEPAKKEAGIKIQEETPEDSANESSRYDGRCQSILGRENKRTWQNVRISWYM